MDTRRGGVLTPLTLNNHKATGLHSNTGLEPLEIHKATKTALNAGPVSVCKGNLI